MHAQYQHNLCDIRTLFCIPTRAGSYMPAFPLSDEGREEEGRESSVRSVHKTEEGGGDEGEAAKATECPAGKRGRPSEGHSKHECHSPLREMSPPI